MMKYGNLKLLMLKQAMVNFEVFVSLRYCIRANEAYASNRHTKIKPSYQGHPTEIYHVPGMLTHCKQLIG